MDLEFLCGRHLDPLEGDVNGPSLSPNSDDTVTTPDLEDLRRQVGRINRGEPFPRPVEITQSRPVRFDPPLLLGLILWFGAIVTFLLF